LTCENGSYQLSGYIIKKTPVSHFLRFTAKQAAWRLLLEKPLNNAFDLPLQSVLPAILSPISISGRISFDKLPKDDWSII
jgi:hypothetical protein